MNKLEKSAKTHLEYYYNNGNVAHNRDEICSTYNSVANHMSTFTYKYFLEEYQIRLNIPVEKTLQFLLLKDNAPYFTDKNDDYCESYEVLSKNFALFASEYL